MLATNPETGEKAAEPVVATITGTGVKDLVQITVTDSAGVTGTVEATVGHPFWVPDIQEWVDAGDLRAGQWLQTSSGTWVLVTAVEYDHREQTVHNLTIDTSHTYNVYAGNTDLLTHNCGGNAVQAGISGMDDVASYGAQKAITAGHRGAIQAHHLIEQRFSRQMGGNAKDWASVVLTRKTTSCSRTRGEARLAMGVAEP